MMSNTTKKVLALATAGLIVFSTTTVFANEGTEDLGLEVITENNTNVGKIQENTANEENEVATEEPSVLPGSLFYFMKTAFEKIRLALTFEDSKEAKLFATYAMERLEEAEALFKEGQEDKALKTIYDALAYLENAENMVDEEKTTTIEETTEVGSIETEPVSEESQEVTEPTTEETVSTEDSQDEALQDVEELISQNIIALTAALEKVKNPAAKVALRRNIEKSYANLARKMEKIAEKKEELEAVTEYAPAKVKDETHANIETKEKVKAEIKTTAEAKSETTKTEAAVMIERPKAVTLKNKQVEAKQKIKDMKSDYKANVQQIKNEIKETKKQVRQDANIEKKVEKIESKIQKHISVKIEKKDLQNKEFLHQENK